MPQSLLFLLTDEPYDRERFRRRQPREFSGRNTFVPTAEDVLIAKLRWFRLGKRTKNIDDVRNVLAVQANRLDWQYVEHWCGEHGTLDLLQELREAQPPT